MKGILRLVFVAMLCALSACGEHDAQPDSGLEPFTPCLIAEGSAQVSTVPSRPNDDMNMQQPSVGDPCESVVRAGQVLSGDGACAVKQATGAVDTSMYCHPALKVCELPCTTDAECPHTWICDDSADTRAASGGRGMCVAHCGGGPEVASSDHVGEPCHPDGVPAAGFSPLESYLGTTDPECGGGVCLVHHLDGDPTCPETQSTDTHRCASSADTQNSVYCSCRCHAPEGYAECTCPDGMSCVSVLDQAAADLRGGYCVRDLGADGESGAGGEGGGSGPCTPGTDGCSVAGGYNAVCQDNAGCDPALGLVCVGAGVSRGICTTACASDGDCVVHGGDSKCVGAGMGNGACYETCMDSVQCPSTHTCYMTATEAFGTCRPAQ